MRVLLVSPLIQECNYTGDFFAQWPQLGICYLASTLENAGHEVKIIERKIIAGPVYPRGKNLEKLDAVFLQQAAEFKPELVGITATTPVIMDAYHAAGLLKRFLPELKVIIGGRHATSLPETTLSECPDIDMVCVGEGELTLLDLANKVPVNDVLGIAYRSVSGKVVLNQMRKLGNNLDDIPSPAWHLLDRDFYFRPSASVMRGDYMRSATMFTSRGCPYNCSFCQSPELLKAYRGNYIRFHSVPRVLKEIKYLVDTYDVNGISFSDDLFSMQRQRVFDICQGMIDQGFHKAIKFVVNLRADRADREMLLTLKEAGCIHVVYGCESGSEETLKRMNKELDLKKSIEIIRLTKKLGLTCESNIVIGTPGETKNDFLKTIQFLKDTSPNRIFVSKFYPIPGTEFYDMLIHEKKIIPPKNWNDLNTLYVETDNFTFADMASGDFMKLRNKANREVVLWINYMYFIKHNIRNNPGLAVSQLLKMLAYVSFYYLPLVVQIKIKLIVGKMSYRVRYFFRK